eukprot:gnl/Spiro4/6800_TR3516_c0_g1_i1.p1 gnl/Spiro4/6800_TR3516_c0_g1~~gnl/Spiro4/6800_TR3516_c0_g1_i1.p1  ORF type:complete len:171 (-),score=23.19 gnl/Spiro4/6800_TR3516_c0_g1_i1:143-607(-)
MIPNEIKKNITPHKQNRLVLSHTELKGPNKTYQMNSLSNITPINHLKSPLQNDYSTNPFDSSLFYDLISYQSSSPSSSSFTNSKEEEVNTTIEFAHYVYNHSSNASFSSDFGKNNLVNDNFHLQTNNNNSFCESDLGIEQFDKNDDTSFFKLPF